MGHTGADMVETDQGMIAWRLLQRLLKGGEFSVAEVPMALPRYLRVEEYDLPRLPDHTACEVNRPALEVGVHSLRGRHDCPGYSTPGAPEA